MAVLGIESSAHTLGIGIAEHGKVLANVKAMYRIGKHGMIPMRVADTHTKNLHHTLKLALETAGLGMRDIEAVGYTKGPGLGPCLRVGQIAARSIAISRSIPIFHVNHAIGHIEVTRHLLKVKDPIALYVSGGNSQVLGLERGKRTRYRVYGETFDIGVGNMLDNFARAAGLVPAWGSSVARAAEGGSYIRMPYTVRGMDFTFTGLLTHAVRALAHASVNDVAYSLQETAFAMLCEATERAMLLKDKHELMLCGGVAQSSRLRAMLGEMAREHGARLHVAPNEFNADNGGMIAIVAEKLLRSGAKHNLEDCTVNQRYRADSVEITW